MDIEYIKEKIYNLDEKKKIQPGDFLSTEVIELLRQGNTTSRVACFAKTNESAPSKNVHLFPSEIVCSRCGNLTVQSISKTHLFNYLQGNSKIVCDECQKQIDIQKEKERDMMLLQESQRQQEKNKNAEMYIENYLIPNKTWDKDLAPKERTHLIIGLKSNTNYDIIANHIKSMSYKDFLDTLYWATISEYKKFKSNYKCALCGSNKNLATHHSSYDRHGHEHEYSVIEEDLIVLCQNCHSKFHDKF